MSNNDQLVAITKLAKSMDSAFRIPGTKIRFGWDSIIGVFPAAGDTITMFVSLYIIWRVYQMGASTSLILSMLGNVVLDWLLGAIPLLGDFFDVAFKANTRNIRLLEKYIEKQIALGQTHQNK